MTVQIKLLLPFHSERVQQTHAAVQRAGVDIAAQLDTALPLGSHSRLKLLIGIDGRPFRRICRHAGDGHHCQQHHKHQQDADDATSCVCFCHIITSSLNIILKICLYILCCLI